MLNRIDKKTLSSMDIVFMLSLFVLLGASLLILSTASYNLIEDNPYHYVKTQAVWIISGLFIAGFVAYIDYIHWQKIIWWIYGANIFLLLLVIIVGSSAKGAQRWIPITSSISIQPSEFAKIFIIICFADFLVKRRGKLNTYRDFIPPFLYMLVPMLMILIQPDLGTALVFGAIFVGMMLIAGANPKKFCGIIFVGVLIVGLGFFFHFAANLPWPLSYLEGLPLPLQDYQLDRLTSFVNPGGDLSGDGYHVLQSVWAIGSGGLLGKGYQNGTQGQLNFLPEHHTDFIFSVVGEEFGFIGTVTLLFVFCIFLMRAISIGMKSRDFYGLLIVTGVVSMFLFHILINVGMTSGIMPVTGLPLPFISSGGSSMWANMMAVGLVLSVGLRRERNMF
ncbi:MAG: rod shape-determining protein RodA [Eubacteriales bacterium]